VDTRNLVIGAVLLVIAGVTWWLAKQNQPQESVYNAKGDTPDYYVEGFTDTQMDGLGRPSQRLAAERMTHYPESDTTELTQPRIRIYDGERPPWRVRARSGWISGDGQVVLLRGTVHIDRSASPSIRPVHIITRDLRVQPKENYAETDEPIKFTSNNDRVDAKGMQAWFNPPVRIKLLANVRGHYEAQ